MAKEKKGQKFGRHRDRSPAAKMYKAASKDKVNKIKKLKRHVKKHPQDLRNASSLKALQGGGNGAAVVFPVPKNIPDKHKPDGVQDLDVEYREHHVQHGKKGKDGKRQRVIVLHEAVASKPLYWVESEGKVKTVEEFKEKAEEVFNKSHHTCYLLELIGDKTSLVQYKPATPPPGWERQVKRQFAGWKL